MQRLRLKADGRIVELRDGQEFPLAPAMPAVRRRACEAAAQPAVRDLRRRARLTQLEFAARLGVPVETIRNWEQGKRAPRGPARALLAVIAHSPETVFAALATEPAPGLIFRSLRKRQKPTHVGTASAAAHNGARSARVPVMNFIEANGAKIPAIGLGTWELRDRTCARIVEQALRLGYRHIDTAQVYENEREVGEGVRASGVKRDEIFLTTKIWTTHFKPNDLERSAKESLARLRMTEVDLLLLHWPNPQVPLAETLGALARVKQLGLARHIGVSNFTVALIEEAVAACPEPLVCDQVEYHPYLDQTKVREACARHGMAVVAYSPVAKGRIKNDRALLRIGDRYRKTAAQVCLRWLVQQNVAAIPRTSKLERLSENIDIFDFELSEDDMTRDFRDGKRRRPADRLRLRTELGLRICRAGRYARVQGDIELARKRVRVRWTCGGSYRRTSRHRRSPIFRCWRCCCCFPTCIRSAR